MTEDRTRQRRRRRADSGTVRLSERDVELLAFVGEQYTVTLKQLARLAGVSYNTARSIRSRWRRAGWVMSFQLHSSGDSFLWLTRKGTRVALSPYRALAPDPGLALHTAAVTDVRLLLERELGLGCWTCERELLRQTWALRERPHMPDAVLETLAGRVAVEVELTLKGVRRLDLIVGGLARRYDAVWYFATPRVAATLERLAADARWRTVRVHRFPPEIEEIAP
jgi:DNA-binding CsgD family transcriptional regulator